METSDVLLPTLRRAAQDLVAQRTIRDLELTLDAIVNAAVQTVPGADDGGVSFTDGGTVTSRSPTSDAVNRLDRLQSELHEGPCISAIDDAPEDGIVLAGDLDGDDAHRWPRFAPQAVEAGYGSILSVGLDAGPGARAALNLYSAQPHAFAVDARITAGLFGVQAALLLYGSTQAGVLVRAVDSRDVIGQAKGILMERFGVDDDEAFQMLVRSSQDINMKLVDCARWLQKEAIEHRRRSRETTDNIDNDN
ncbi:ANTAR domain-containing protein [Actinomycetospora sp. TBRC 11914]|uniref:ANTAR domain-containing protein n=1 Tax=Actinomycetospora sp. TBRC 11914 TaxID=2729387 RepID=UPI00145D3786|nr:ANTAR domain-containing protein [Actinomycetospora sp. TBRC 11914]NMO93129.1 ANTAR domain-containing protein [Actinomycetospora sp. TBRC 11914]